MTTAQQLNYTRAKNLWLTGDIEGSEYFDESFSDTFEGSGIAEYNRPLTWPEIEDALQNYVDAMLESLQEIEDIQTN